jgi:hypothetical protein
MLNGHTATIRPDPATTPRPNGFKSSRASRRWRRVPRGRTLVIALVFLIGALGMAWDYGVGLPGFSATGRAPAPETIGQGRSTSPRSRPIPSGKRWDGLVRVDEQAQAALGVCPNNALTGPLPVFPSPDFFG